MTAVFAAVLLSIGSAHAATDTHLSQRRQAARALIARADAESLATAAALSFKHEMSPGALELAVSAADLAPQNPIIGWLHLRLCVETPPCDFRDVATVLRWTDADNGASWLPILAAANKDEDSTEIDRVIADMAQTKRFDVYGNPLIVLMADALSKVRGQLPKGFAASDAGRLELVSGIAAGLQPSFDSLLAVCRGAAAERREACLKLARIMQHGDAIAAQTAGFEIERRLLPPDGKAVHALNERRRLLEARVAAAARADVTLPWLKNSRARRRLAQMRARPRQEDVDLAILREHKSSADNLEMRP